MTCRTILQWPNKSLEDKSEECGNISDDIVENVNDVVDTLKASFGVGLAAPQVGIKKRIVAVAPSVAEIENPYPQEGFEDHLVLIDPVLETKGHQFTWNEACLSVPFVNAPVKRYSQVSLSFTSLKGERVNLDIGMPLAGILQHECDHLDGTLFIDRASRFFKEKLVKKLNKEARIFKKQRENEKRQLILETQGPGALRKYLSTQGGSSQKKTTRKKAGKSYGKNKKRK